MQPMLSFLVPALVLHLPAEDQLPFEQRVQHSIRLSEPGLRALQSELSSAPDKPYKPYWQALVESGLASRAKDPKAGAALLQLAMQRLEGRKDADSLGLLGSLYGMSISYHPDRAMDLVGKAMSCFDLARRQAPANPRVHFFQSIHLLNTPEAFGGGPAVAIPLLEAALAKADGEPPQTDSWIPAWGKVEILAWLALAEARTGRMVQARDHLERCLKLDPDYPFATSFVAPLIKQER